MKRKQYNNYKDEIPLDDYEKELKEFLDKGKFVNAKNFNKNKSSLVEDAKRYLERNESKSITLRIKKKDLIKLRAKAARNNIPYQTLIGVLINSYTEGKTKLTL